MGVGIPEDPATGSGNGCLAAYLVQHRCLGNEIVDVQVGQGYEMGRPSRLFLKARPEGSGIRVEVGGRVHQVAEGWWDEDHP
jgi:trans-2,3-dihydro-3-hydroxyanthranilate isomerase